MSVQRFGQIPFAIALGLVALPNLMFLATHLASPILATACVSCALAGFLWTLRAVWRHTALLDLPLLAVALGAGFALSCLGGQAHLFYANDDWLIRDAVLRDLVVEPWPVGYRYLGDATMLRAPLGLYLVPAAIGKLLGLPAAHAALLAQSSLLFGCLFYVFTQSFPPRKASLVVLAVFIAYGGWDIVGTWLLNRNAAFGTHLEQWAGDQQFSSHVTQLFWVPNHAASGWTFAAAYLLWHRGRLDAGSLICVFGFCAFWSPLSMIGALPFLARALISEVVARRVGAGQWPAPILTFLGLMPVLLYLLADGGRVAQGFRDIDGIFLLVYALFLVLEIGPALLVLRAARGPAPDGRRSLLGGDMPIVIAILLFVPLYRLGANDFVMRASIPALALLALRLGEVAAAPSTPGLRWAALVVVALGAGAPIYEIGRAVQTPAFAISTCTLLDASRVPPNEGPLFHYLARTEVVRNSVAGSVLASPRQLIAFVPRPPCWPDRIAPSP